MAEDKLNWWGRGKVAHYFAPDRFGALCGARLGGDMTRFPRDGGEWRKCPKCLARLRKMAAKQAI